MVSDAFGRLESFWQAVGGSFLGGWLVVEDARKLFFSRDPERPFDTERPRNWGSLGAELNGLKPWRRGGFRCFLGGWLVVENASKLSFFYRDPKRPFDTERRDKWTGKAVAGPGVRGQSATVGGLFWTELDWEKLWRGQVFGVKMTETNGHKLLFF